MSDPIIASVLAGAGLDTARIMDDAGNAGRDSSEGGQAASVVVDPTAGRAGEASTSVNDDDGPSDDDGDDDEPDDADDTVGSDDDDADDDDGPRHGNEAESDDDAANDGDGDDTVGSDEDDELEEREPPDPAKSIIESFPDDDGEDDVEVVEVGDPASCLALPTKARSDREDRRLVELRGKGFTDEQLRAVGAVLTTASRRQRKLPVHAAVCSPVMQAYWADRDRERREADCMKAIRNDGGQLGPVRYYESIIRKHDPLAAAKLLAEHHAERITAIRYIVTATFNEGRREDAVAKGVDPTTVKYLQVRAK